MISSAIQLAGKIPVVPVLVGIGIAGAFVLAPSLFIEAVIFALWNMLLVSPVIAVGVFLTAGITASGSMGLIAGAFHGRQGRMIGAASLIGALTPVCGVTVLPLVAGLLAARVPLAPIMAFWLSSPITDPGMLAITAGTLGMPFAIAKTLAAFGIGLVGGGLTLAMIRAGCFQNPVRETGVLAKITAKACTSCVSSTISWRFWREPERLALFRETSIATGRLMIVWLALAFTAEFFMNLYLPDSLITSMVGQESVWAVPIAAVIGAPIYLDGYAALPFIRGLMDAGMRQDAALTFLIAGGITSAWAAIPVFALVKKTVFTFYIALAVAVSMLAGWTSGLYFTQSPL
ncbi:MAG: permease [Stappiaceae bacterium]